MECKDSSAASSVNPKNDINRYIVECKDQIGDYTKSSYARY